MNITADAGFPAVRHRGLVLAGLCLGVGIATGPIIGGWLLERFW